MATEQPGDIFTLKTDQDWNTTSKQYYAVYLASTGYAALSTGASPIFGILQAPVDGSTTPAPCPVMAHGKSFCVYGGGVTVGDNLCAAADGRLIKSTAPTTDIVCGVAADSGAANDVGSVYLDIQSGSTLGVSIGPPNTQPVRIPLNTLLGNDGTIISGIPVPSSGTLTGIYATIESPCSVAGKSGSLTVASSQGAVTGGVLSLTSANCGQAGATAAIKSTAAGGAGAALDSTHTLSLVWAHSTAFTAQDTGVIWVYFVTTT